MLQNINQFKKTASNNLNITLNRKNVGLIGGIDTITFCYHFITNGQIYIGDGLILDFSDNTKEPVLKFVIRKIYMRKFESDKMMYNII